MLFEAFLIEGGFFVGGAVGVYLMISVGYLMVSGFYLTVSSFFLTVWASYLTVSPFYLTIPLFKRLSPRKKITPEAPELQVLFASDIIYYSADSTSSSSSKVSMKFDSIFAA